MILVEEVKEGQAIEGLGTDKGQAKEGQDKEVQIREGQEADQMQKAAEDQEENQVKETTETQEATEDQEAGQAVIDTKKGQTQIIEKGIEEDSNIYKA